MHICMGTLIANKCLFPYMVLGLGYTGLVLRMGFMVCIQYILRLKVGALLFSGLPCSLHVWIAKGTSLKTRDNPRGTLLDGSYTFECVRLANMIACRYALCVLICIVRAVWWATEQPSSSLAQFLPYLEHVLNPAKVMLGFAPGLVQRLCLGSMEWVAVRCS